MSILTRYISRRLVLYYLAFLVIMVALFVFVDFMENIDRVTKLHAPFRLISMYYAYFLPRIVTEISWVGFLVAALFVLGSLAKNNEFTAMCAGGISIYSVGVPVLILGVLLYAGIFCIQEFVVPRSTLRAYEINENDFTRLPENRNISDFASVGRSNNFYSFDVVDVERGVLTGVHIHTARNDAIIQRIDAEEAVWDRASGRWYLKNGTIKKFDSDEIVTETIPFDRMKAPFRESPKTLEMYSAGDGGLNFREMRQQIKNLEKSGYDARRLRVSYYTKFAFPATNILVVFLALPFALEFRRGGLAISFALSLTTALLYYGAFQIGLALGKGGSLPAAISAWLANFLFLSVGAALTMKART